MNKILIIFAHPAISRSTMNRAMKTAVDDLDGVTVHDLYRCYPDFYIDVAHEQRLCEEHDVIIFQHPFYWYSTPSIIKEWLDLVLQHGWAYGSEGRALEGKYYFHALTAGGDDSTYRHQGANLFTVSELLSPYRATANLCRMRWLPPFAVLGIHQGLADELIRSHALDYRRMVTAFRDEMVDLEAITDAPYLNSKLTDIIRQS
ncbi:MAG: NAD(P)H-dependent oxidoreductase [Desulfofustis sp.]|nr:NAD(P)H-dependent oxidoreductase [Desulfofustis sp.]MBT8356127.1 NAD(P)H-dependent oxidoreductase [Desulfofustis sp.]NNK57178.1 NAD(P)H oxidoreductase [Desulfofustis sp.]